eukprot:3747311-Prorocentrum_lima.AAC.1
MVEKRQHRGQDHLTEVLGEPKREDYRVAEDVGQKEASTAAKTKKHQTSKEAMAKQPGRRSRTRRKDRK